MGRAQTRCNAFYRKTPDWKPAIGDIVWLHGSVRPHVPGYTGRVLNLIGPDWLLVEVVRGCKRPRTHKIPLQLFEVAPKRGKPKPRAAKP